MDMRKHAPHHAQQIVDFRVGYARLVRVVDADVGCAEHDTLKNKAAAG